MTYYGYPSYQAWREANPPPRPHVTIHDDTSFPVRYKRTDKPRLKIDQYGIWYCACPEVIGLAYSPAAAYRAWVRNHFIGSPGPRL